MNSKTFVIKQIPLVIFLYIACMQRITTLLQKINELASKDKDAGVIDIDLMMDYTRVLYADLIDWRSRVLFNSSLEEADGNTMPTSAPTAPATQPTPPQLAAPPPTPVQKPEPEPAPPPQAQTKVEIPPHEEPEHTTTEIPVAPSPQPPADIRKWIGINDKYQFISELFGNDKESYEDVLSELNRYGNYEAAAAHLDEIQDERGWNDDDITIQSFYGIVSQFFAER